MFSSAYAMIRTVIHRAGAEALYRSGGIHFLLHAFRKPCLRILVYHQVAPVSQSIAPRVLPETFQRQIEYLKREYTILPLWHAVEMLQKGTLPPRALSITFDDGYANVATVAAPILEDHNVPATIFISSGLVADGSMSWTDVVNYAIESTSRGEIVVTCGMKKKVFRIRTFAEKQRFCEMMESAVMKESEEHRKRFVHEVLSQVGAVYLPGLMLTPAQVQYLSRDGFEIGSHGVTHRCLALLDAPDVLGEVRTSKEYLEKITGVPVQGFSYPSAEFGPMVRDAVRLSGYRYAADVGNDVNRPGQDCFALKRIHVREEPLAVFAWRVYGMESWIRRVRRGIRSLLGRN